MMGHLVMGRVCVHWFPVAGLLEDFRCHVSRRPTCRGQDVKLFLVHDPAQSKIGNQQIRIVLGCPE